jgi:ribosome-associated translation inhibitor RaiA
MSIEIRGLGIHPRLRTHITRRMSGALSRRHIRPVGARVTFTDEDGPRGGVGVRCALTVRVPGRPTLRVEHQARTHREAFEGSFESLKRQLERTTRRRRQRGRYPKKYFVARRLLEAPRDVPTEPRRRTSS